MSSSESLVRCGELSLNLYRGPRSGPPILFLHGVLRHWRDYTLQLPHFSARWETLALDFRGHGGSQRVSTGYRVTDYAWDVVTFLEGHVAEPVVIYGHSLGAMVACAVAAEAGERVRAVVLEDPPFETLGPGIVGTPFHAQFLGMRDALRRCPEDVDALARELAEIRIPTAAGTVRLGDLRDPTQLRFSAASLLKLDPAVFKPLLDGEWLEGFAVDEVLAAVRCPALLLAADWNAGGMMPPTLADRVAAILPRCTRVDLKGTGHNARWADPVGTLKLTTAFLESLD